MKTIAYTWVLDYREMAEKMIRSFHYFHPTIPFRVFDRKDIEPLGVSHEFCSAPLGKILAGEGYDLVIHIDADMLVTAPLTRMLESSADMMGTRANSDDGLGVDFLRNNVLTGEPLHPLQELNTGLFAVRNPDVWDHWIKYNSRYGRSMPMVEMDVWNDLFWSEMFASEVMDPSEVPEYWNTASKWGCPGGVGVHQDFLSSWQGLFVLDGGLWLRSNVHNVEKRVRALHTAGGSWPGKNLGFDAPLVQRRLSPEVRAYLQMLTEQR